MNKLFGLFLRALLVRLLALQMAFYPLAPVVYRGALTLPAVIYVFAADIAEAACSGGACFWIGGTATLNLSTDQANWSTSSGGASCSCVPATTDTITLDGSSGGGTVTVNVGALWTAASISIGNFTGTLDFATNNNTPVSTPVFTPAGAATKTLNMGSNTFSITGNSGLWNCATCANLTLNAGTSTIVFTGTGGSSARRFLGGGKTYATVSAVSGTSPFNMNGASTIGTLTISPGNTVVFAGNSTQTITTLTNISGSSSNQTLFTPGDPITSFNSIVLTNNWTCDWCGFSATVFTGAGSKTATNSFDFKGNSGITITAPSVGGGGGGRIIGG